MRIQNLRCSCRACGWVFDGEVVVEAPTSVAVASLNAIYCPKCGAAGDQIALGGERTATGEKPKTIEERAEWWLQNGDVGNASATMWAALSGRPTPLHTYDVPHTPADFFRCRRLLELIPEWRTELPKVAEKHPIWAPFVKEWNRLDGLYSMEAVGILDARTGGPCPQLSKAIQKLVKESDKIKYPKPKSRMRPAKTTEEK